MKRSSAVTAAGLIALCVAGLCMMPAAVGAEDADEESQLQETLVRGIIHHSGMIETIDVTARVHWILSDRYRERIAGRARRADAQIDGGAASSARPPSPSLRKPEDIDAAGMDGHEDTWVRCQYDGSARRWHIQTVALTNNGCPDVSCSLAARPSDRSVPPWLLYRSILCDGEKEYWYDRSDNTGFIQYRAREDPLSLHFSNLQAYAILGVGAWETDRLRSGEARGRYLGASVAEGIGQIHELEWTYVSGQSQNVTRIGVSPGKGFAVVAYDVVKLKQAGSPGSGASRLERARKCTPSDFVEVADGLWCPRRVRIDDFDYSLGNGMDSWMCSRVYDVLELRVNEPVKLVTPYPYPFDARITDATTPPVPGTGVRPLPSGPHPPPAPPEWTTEGAMDLVRTLAGQDSEEN